MVWLDIIPELITHFRKINLASMLNGNLLTIQVLLVSLEFAKSLENMEKKHKEVYIHLIYLLIFNTQT